MAIQTLTYLDIPAAKRRDSAARALARLRERLADGTLSEQQRQQLNDQATHLENWVSGKIQT